MTAKKTAAKKTAKKTVTKKTAAKKTAVKKKVVKLPALNKKNATAFADMLYSDKNGVVTFTKLCDGSLMDGKAGTKNIHCAVGEAAFQFVNRNVAMFGGDTDRAIEALVGVAQLKDTAHEGTLADALQSCVDTNDDGRDDGSNAAIYAERAASVAKIWLEEVVPLLK